MKQITMELPDTTYAAEPAMWDTLFDAMQKAVNRMAVGYAKYHLDKNVPLMDDDADTVAFIRQRLAMYVGPTDTACDCDRVDGRHAPTCFLVVYRRKLDTGNIENLLDVANGCFVEFIRPSHTKAHFKSQTSSDSPGLARK
jgi:hypothetical protein